MFDKKVGGFFQFASLSKGEVGIEVEVEAKKYVDGELLHKNPKFGWRYENDGSLKVNGVEFVLNKPVARENVGKALKNLRKVMDKAGVEINPSIRAGVHIHINFQEETLGTIFKFLMLFYSIETALIRYCGEGREGNLFCLRTRDANNNLNAIEKAVMSEEMTYMRSNNYRYAAMNFQSLFSYGSLESRSLATTPELDNIEDWVAILLRIKDYAKGMGTCWDAISSVSGDGPREYLRSIVGDKYCELLDYPEIEQDIMEDVRNIQYTCHILSEKGV